MEALIILAIVMAVIIPVSYIVNKIKEHKQEKHRARFEHKARG